MCQTLCHCVPGLQPKQAWLYWCHRLLIWTKAFGNGFGVSATPRGTKAVSGHEGRVVATAECSQTHLRLHLCGWVLLSRGRPGLSDSVELSGGIMQTLEASWQKDPSTWCQERDRGPP